ncbi:hypothetical protein P879_03303 [Paragonimus westermani]|uniref:Uncharacterized protein n=1 Tax=Paragonimus westermani TaxID=34504 RepID=A0A8T0DE04_9TREM|nr:hypothetical protein P879_03303 [Paragonimus westermani]
MEFQATTGCMLVSATEPNIRLPLQKLTNLRFVSNLIPGPYRITCKEEQKLILIVRDCSPYLDCSAVPAMIDQNLSYPNNRLCVYRPKLRTEWMKFAGSIVEQATEFPKCMIGRFPANKDSLLTLSLIQRLPLGKSNLTCGQQHSQTVRVIRSPSVIYVLRTYPPQNIYWKQRTDVRFFFTLIGSGEYTDDKLDVDFCDTIITRPNGTQLPLVRLSLGMFTKQMQHYGGFYNLTCTSLEFGLTGNSLKLLLTPHECGFHCVHILRIPNPQDENKQICYCKGYRYSSSEYISPPAECEGSLPTGEPVLFTEKFQLEPLATYPRQLNVSCFACWNLNDCSVKTLTLYFIDPPHRDVEIRERTPGAVHKLSRLYSDFSVCVVWTTTPTEMGCSFDELSIPANCSYSVKEVVDSRVDVTCSIPDHNVSRRFTVEVLIDRPVLLVCNDMNIIVEPNSYRKRYTICDWHAVPGKNNHSNWTIPLVCTSYPSGLVFADGTIMLNQSIFEDTTYTVKCNNETAIARFYPTDGYVSLSVEPTQSYFLFGQSGPAKFYFNYTQHLRSFAKDRLTCTVILKPDEKIDGFRFVGDTLVFGHPNVSNTLRTNYGVKCADEFLERWSNITVYHPLNLQLVIEGERRSIYFSGIFLSFSCKIQFPNSNAPSSDPHLYWEPGSVRSFTVSEHNITMDTQNVQGVFHPTCIYHYDPHEMNESVYFMIYDDVTKMKLEIDPDDDVVAIDHIQMLHARLRWYGSDDGADLASLLATQNIFCVGAITEPQTRTVQEVRFINHYPAVYLSTGLLTLTCHCKLPNCEHRLVSFLYTLDDAEVSCPNHLLISLESRYRQFVLCEHVYQLPSDWVTTYKFPTAITRMADCIDPSNQLDVRNGTLYVTKPLEKRGIYNVSCAQGKNIIPVYLYSETVLLLAFPTQPFYVFGNNSNITFHYAYIVNGTVELQPFDEHTMHCQVIPLPSWTTGHNPFVFHHNVLYLNVSQTARMSHHYRVRCDVDNGLIQRVAEARIMDVQDLRLRIIGPNVSFHTPQLPGEYICELESMSLNSNVVGAIPQWQMKTTGNITIIHNKLVLNSFTSVGEHVAECSFEKYQLKLNTIKRLFFYSTDPGKRVKLCVHPPGPVIFLFHSGKLSAFFRWQSKQSTCSDDHDNKIALTTCGLLYYPVSEKSPEIVFVDQVKMDNLQPGQVIIRCTSADGVYYDEVNLTLTDEPVHDLECTQSNVIYRRRRAFVHFPICHYVQNTKNRLRSHTLPRSVECLDRNEALRINDGTLVLTSEDSPLGYFDVSCENGLFNTTLLIYDDSLQLKPVEPNAFWIHKTEEVIQLEFVFDQLGSSVHLEPRGTTVKCHLDEDGVVSFSGLQMTFELNANNTESRTYTVECSMHDGQVVRSVQIELYNEEDLRLVVDGPNTTMHFISESYVYTCRLINTKKPGDQTLMAEPQWIARKSDERIKLHANFLFIDSETGIGRHSMMCVYVAPGRLLKLAKDFFVCDKNSDIEILLTPKSTILTGHSADHVSAQLEYTCSNDPKIMRYTKSLTVKCEVKYTDMFNNQRLTFQSRIAFNQLPAGEANFDCHNEETGYSAQFRRIILPPEEFELSCHPHKIVNAQLYNVHMRMCAKNLKQVQPWTTVFPVNKWPAVPVKCNDTAGQLEFSEPNGLVVRPTPPAGIYHIVCDGGRFSKDILLLDSTVRLTTKPERHFVILGLDKSIVLAFTYRPGSTDGFVFIEDIPMNCFLGERMLKTVSNGSTEYFEVLLDEGTFGNESKVRQLRCETLDGQLSGTVDLLVVLFARLELTIIGAWHTFHEFGTSFSYTCYVSRPPEIAGQARTEWVKTQEDIHIHIEGPTATLQPELGPGDYKISCAFKQGGHAISKILAVKVISTGHKDSRLILSADGPQVKWSGSPTRPVRCELLQTIRHFNASNIPSWKRLYGTQSFRVSKCSSSTYCDSTLLYLGETNGDHAMTTYACQFGLQTRCLSKLFIQVNMKRMTYARIELIRRVHLFGKPIQCNSDGEPQSLKEYTWTLLLGNPSTMVANSHTVTWSGHAVETSRNLIECRVVQIYLGRPYVLVKTEVFIQLKHSTKVAFTPNLHFYRRLNTLSCEVIQADGYTTPTYMMLEKYPNSFQPAIWYEVIRFRNHFPGGEYVIACHYISEHATRESIRKRILLYETPRRLYIHQTPVEPEGYRFACVSDGYPPVPARIVWTILTGSKYGFEHVNDGLSLTKFAPYGVYQIQCNATFVYPDAQMNLHIMYNFSYTSRDPKNHTDGATVVRATYLTPFTIVTLCWTLFHIRVCLLLMANHSSITNTRRPRAGPKSGQTDTDDYLELDTRELDPAELHHFREMLRDFDIVQQIMAQVIQAKRHLRMSDRNSASEITDLTYSASSGKWVSGRTISMSSVDRRSLEQ